MTQEFQWPRIMTQESQWPRLLMTQESQWPRISMIQESQWPKCSNNNTMLWLLALTTMTVVSYGSSQQRLINKPVIQGCQSPPPTLKMYMGYPHNKTLMRKNRRGPLVLPGGPKMMDLKHKSHTSAAQDCFCWVSWWRRDGRWDGLGGGGGVYKHFNYYHC